MKKVEFKDGSIFDGEFINPLNIKGKLTYTNGNFAEGEFQIINNLPQINKGKLTFKNGDFNKGEFKDGEFIKGISHTKNNGVFEGELRNGLFFKGKLINEGDIFEGDFKYGIPKKGKTILGEDGTIFEGEFEDGFFIPLNGKEERIDGTVFQGEFKNGNYFKGTLSKINMFLFNGELKNNVPYKGKINFFMNNILNGHFEGELKDGLPFKGKFKSSKGWTFEGEYIELPLEEHPKDYHTGIKRGFSGGFLPTIKKGKLILHNGSIEGSFKLKNVYPPEGFPDTETTYKEYLEKNNYEIDPVGDFLKNIPRHERPMSERFATAMEENPNTKGFENIKNNLDENGNITNETLKELKNNKDDIANAEFFYGEVKLIGLSHDFLSSNYSLVLDEKITISVNNGTHLRLLEHQFDPPPPTFFIMAPIMAVEETNGTIPNSCIQWKSPVEYLELRLKYNGF
jgi:hypothetical protein